MKEDVVYWMNGLGQVESNIYRDMGIRPDVYELYEEGTGKRVLVIEISGYPIGLACYPYIPPY